MRVGNAWWLRVCAGLCILHFGGCAEETGGTAKNRPKGEAPTDVWSAQKKEGKMTITGAGLKYEDLKEGAGPAAKIGDEVQVHYTGWLKDGTKFDSSRDRNDPFDFRLGGRGVIAGWNEGVPGMKVGGKRKLIIPPDLAYGRRGFTPNIPPDAELTFEVELLSIK